MKLPSNRLPMISFGYRDIEKSSIRLLMIRQGLYTLLFIRMLILERKQKSMAHPPFGCCDLLTLRINSMPLTLMVATITTARPTPGESAPASRWVLKKKPSPMIGQPLPLLLPTEHTRPNTPSEIRSL